MARAKSKPIDPTVRYATIEGKLRKVYQVASFTQVDIFGENQEIASVTTSKKSKTIHQIEVSKLLTSKPKVRKVKSGA